MDSNGNYPVIDPTATPDTQGRVAFPQSEILLVARRPSADERKSLELAEVELDIRPIATDAFVFLVNRKNKVESLTLEQIQYIYAPPQKKSWKDFGGSESLGEFIPYERNLNSGSRELMDELVVTPAALKKYAKNKNAQKRSLDGNEENVDENKDAEEDYDGDNENFAKKHLPMLEINSGADLRGNEEFRKKRKIFGAGGGMSFIIHNLVQEANAIGYSVYHYEHFMLRVPETRVLAVNGVFPNYENIRTKKYPLIYEVYVVTRKGIANDSPAAKLREWLLTNDGQRAIRESGYVPINTSIANE